MITGVPLKILVALAAALMLAAAVIPVWTYVRAGLRRFARMGFGRQIAALACVVLIVHYGGSKSIMNKTGHDDDIPLADAQYYPGASVTNVLAYDASYLDYTGTNVFVYAFGFTNGIDASEWAMGDQNPNVWYRENNRQAWTNITSGLPDGVSLSEAIKHNRGTTNFVYYSYVGTNKWQHAQFYVGDNLPAVYVDIEGGITLDRCDMTSKMVTITYTVSEETVAGRDATVTFERLDFGGRLWQTIRTEEATAGTHTAEFPGFMVDLRRMWRIRLDVAVDGTLSTQESEEDDQ